jgi:hypothetical protein
VSFRAGTSETYSVEGSVSFFNLAVKAFMTSGDASGLGRIQFKVADADEEVVIVVFNADAEQAVTVLNSEEVSDTVVEPSVFNL